MARRGPQIPRDKLLEGIPLCIARAREIFEAARECLRTSNVASANLFVLAVQEVGKAGALADAYATGRPTLTVESFYDHQAKTNKGISLLGERVAWLRTGAFQPNAFQSDAFDVGTPTSEETRLDLLYVGFSDTWQRVPDVDEVKLAEALDHALDTLPGLERELLIKNVAG
ncbi:MAG: hypothetical protein QM831_25535 [Kofleriaceae bacterium]